MSKWWKELDADGEWNVGTNDRSICICADEAGADQLLAALDAQRTPCCEKLRELLETPCWHIAIDDKYYCFSCWKLKPEHRDDCAVKKALAQPCSCQRTEASAGSEEEIALSIARMVTAYVEGGLRLGTDWRNGLAEIIALRLRRSRVQSGVEQEERRNLTEQSNGYALCLADLAALRAIQSAVAPLQAEFEERIGAYEEARNIAQRRTGDVEHQRDALQRENAELKKKLKVKPYDP